MGKASDSKLFAFLGVFLGIIGFIIVILVRKTDKYAMYYAKQGLVLGILGVAISVLQFILLITIIGAVLIPILWLGLFILWIIGIVNSLSGKEKPVPIIGRFAEKFNF